MTRGLRTRVNVPPKLAVVTILALAGISGCGIGDTRSGRDVPTATEEEVTSQVTQLAHDIATAIGDASLANPLSTIAPCDNDVSDHSDDVQYIQSTYQIKVAEKRYTTAFQRVRDEWSSRGWIVADDAHTEKLAVRESADGLNFTLVSSTRRDTLALIVHSGCFRIVRQR